MLRPSSNLLTPAGDTIMLSIHGYGQGPFSRTLIQLSSVKTDENCLFSMLALAVLSL